MNIVDWADSVVFSNNVINNSYDSGVSTGTGGSPHQVTNIVISGNVIVKENGTDAGFGVDVFGDITDVSITGNTIEGGLGAGIIVQKSTTYYPHRITTSTCANKITIKFS